MLITLRVAVEATAKVERVRLKRLEVNNSDEISHIDNNQDSIELAIDNDFNKD